jgi:hypothetical protein
MRNVKVALLLKCRWIWCAGGLLLISGCSSVAEMDPIDSTAKFAGNTGKGESLHVTLALNEDAAMGRGEMSGRAFVLSVVRSWQGKGTLRFEDGETLPVTIELAQDQNSLLLASKDGEGLLTRSGEAKPEWRSGLSGEFASDTQIPLRVNLRQVGSMIVGTGYQAGQPVAVSGTIQDKQVVATLAFADESCRRVSAVVGNGGKTLTVSGLGETIELRRVRR